eukprot:5204057-Amphidinium_carterae.1
MGAQTVTCKRQEDGLWRSKRDLFPQTGVARQSPERSTTSDGTPRDGMRSGARIVARRLYASIVATLEGRSCDQPEVVRRQQSHGNGAGEGPLDRSWP